MPPYDITQNHTGWKGEWEENQTVQYKISEVRSKRKLTQNETRKS